MRWLLGGLAAAGIVGLSYALRNFTDASLPVWDATTTVLSLVAQTMLAKKWIENWGVWITVNVLYIGIYAAKGLYFTSAQQLIFIWLSVMGFVAWRKELLGERAGIQASGKLAHGLRGWVHPEEGRRPVERTEGTD
jgi:nicotinamide mononucleotide transporter